MAVAEPYVAPPVPGRFGRAALRRRGGMLALGTTFDKVALGLLGFVTLLALVGPLLAPNPPDEAVGAPFQAPFSPGFLLGTDDIGRDILSRVLYGIQSSWFSALVVILSGVIIGGIVGLLAGAAGGWVDAVLMRITDTFLALPGPVLAIAVVAALGPGLRNTLVAVGLVWWPYYARIVRGEVRALASRPHVEAARLAGAGRTRIMVRHLLPGTVGVTVVAASLDVSALLLTLASLSFLGLGAPAPAPELGAMTARGLTYLLEYAWIPLVPAVAVFLLALVANLAGDGIRDLIGRR
ncbi:MAG: ABC transporter permease [Acidimicrobiales bacterium]|jgi:peptide/nickel transport system permease protein|nr:ABC transporter permease [Acidimicrobiales bacterium]